jgi:hypothetical protein
MHSRRPAGCRSGAGQTKSPRPPTIVDEGQTASSWYHHDSSPARARDLQQFRTRRVKLSHVNGRGPWRTTAPNRRLVAKLGGVIWGRAAMALAAGASLSVRSTSAPDLSSVSALDASRLVDGGCRPNLPAASDVRVTYVYTDVHRVALRQHRRQGGERAVRAMRTRLLGYKQARALLVHYVCNPRVTPKSPLTLA